MTIEVVSQTWLEKMVLDALSEFDYGSVIPKEWIESHLQVPWPESGTREDYQRVSREHMVRLDEFREVMLYTHRMALRAAGGGNYHIVVPDEQHRHAMQVMVSDIERAARRARKIIDNTNEERLSEAASKARDEARDRLDAFERMAQKRLRMPGVAATLPAIADDSKDS